MSGQPSTNPSGPRPSANGVGAGGMASSQQRTDPQVGSSTSNGQPGNMSQSNLNSIVRQNFLLSSVCLKSVRSLSLLYFCNAFPKTARSIRFDGSQWDFMGKFSSFSIDRKFFKICRTKLQARCVAVLSINTSCVGGNSHASKRLPHHASSTPLFLVCNLSRPEMAGPHAHRPSTGRPARPFDKLLEGVSV